MISFLPLEAGREREVLDFLCSALADADAAEIEEILSSFADDDCEVALSASHGCLLIRIFDGEYLFVYPIALTDSADATAAADEIRLYAIKEEIALTFIDVPTSESCSLLTLFKNTSIEDEDRERESCTVRVYNELMLIDELPHAKDGELSLTPLLESDADAYARLSRESSANEYWGYDFREDNPDADSEYFLRVVQEELLRSSALTLAVRIGGELVGEAVIYYLDMQGGAECAIRLLALHRGKGLGASALDLLMDVCSAIGLDRLYATVKNENIPSIRLFGKRMDILEKNEETTRFCKDL